MYSLFYELDALSEELRVLLMVSVPFGI